jgi:hypothetical protein
MCDPRYRRNAGRHIGRALEPVLPYAAHALAGTAAYTTGLAAAQGLGYLARISCSTPIAGPVGGVLGVGLASALAGQASIACRAWRTDRRRTEAAFASPSAWLRGVRLEDLAVDAALGVAMFALLGGRFRTIMPSDVAKVGAVARGSVPAPGTQYASAASKYELRVLYRRDGCHHCGSRRGQVVGDHMPPNKLVEQHAKSAVRHIYNIPIVGRAAKQAADALGIVVGPPRQRYYPQCESCSSLQSGAMRNSHQKLVLHKVLHPAGRGGGGTGWHAVGALVGLRHAHTEVDWRRKGMPLLKR